MIALRGVIRRVSLSKATVVNSDLEDPKESDFDPKDTKEGEWVWSGHWAFGSLPDDEVLAACKKKKRLSNKVKARPFLYRFCKVVSANDVSVPSAMAVSGRNDEDNNKGRPVFSDAGSRDSMKVSEAKDGSAAKKNYTVENLAIRVDNVPSKNEAEIMNVLNSINIEENYPIKRDKHEVPSELEIEASDFVGVDQGAVKQKSAADGNIGGNDCQKGSCVLFQPQSEESATEGGVTGQQNVTEHVLTGGMKGGGRSEIVPKEEITNKEKHLSSSFALIDGGNFIDGGFIHPKKCPVGGFWRGHFENESRRKDRMTSRIQETFHLYFNSSPPEDSRMVFDLEESSGADVTLEGSGYLPRDHIHVRGAGTNQFGTFEIIGGLNLETGVLSCQKIYISTTDGDEKSGKSKDREKSKAPASTPIRKSYFTRKRPPSFKRSGYGSDEGKMVREVCEKKSSSNGRKRPRGMSEIVSGEDDESLEKSKSIAISITELGARAPPVDIERKPFQIETQIPSVKTQPGGRRPSPVKILQSGRKTKMTSQLNGKSIQLTSSLQINIPKAGNVKDSRWRSAHFLYYNRHMDTVDEPSASPPNSSPTPVTPNKTSFVVYEGEMNSGQNIRDGKGVCLFNNNMIYEGDWRKNKEHGQGSLFNGDRTQTIYVGEWERGKMHGKGTYYYHVFLNETSPVSGGQYVGEFKENSRHGLGKYKLPDGSLYEGEWRDNLPCGKGVFRWADGSEYNGQWKDGKRNGLGRLVATDGFKYDGSWANNAMEGKGKATYPNGQQYDGNWSNGKRDGRGTIIFGNGAVYIGRFKDDVMEGQGTGTLEFKKNVLVPVVKEDVNACFEKGKNMVMKTEEYDSESHGKSTENESNKNDWMIPLEFQSDIGHIHQKAGFTTGGE